MNAVGQPYSTINLVIEILGERRFCLKERLCEPGPVDEAKICQGEEVRSEIDAVTKIGGDRRVRESCEGFRKP